MEATLVLLDPPAAGRELKLSLPATIGRSREAQFKLVHGQVSRLHCEFFERDGVLYVRDLGSTNGTFVDDVPITEAALRPGDKVTIGSVRVQAMYDPAPDAKFPPEIFMGTDTIRKASEATLGPGSRTQLVAPTDTSLDILPAADAATSETATVPDLKWRVPEPSSPVKSDFAFELEQPAPEVHESKATQDQGAQAPPAKKDDDDLDEFLKSLE
jgi:pSer/pThr/pTyr-binding forkhead associated (FHA) protein